MTQSCCSTLFPSVSQDFDLPVGHFRPRSGAEAVRQTHWHTNTPVCTSLCAVLYVNCHCRRLQQLDLHLFLLDKSVVSFRSCDLLSSPTSACVLAFLGVGGRVAKVSISCLRAAFQMGDGVSCRCQGASSA